MVRDLGNAVLPSASRWEMAEEEGVGPQPVRGQMVPCCDVAGGEKANASPARIQWKN